MTRNKNETLLYFPTVIRDVEIADAKSLNAEITGAIDNVRKTEPNSIPDSWSCDLYTTIGSPTTLVQDKAFDPLKKVIVEEANDFARSLELDIDKFPLRFTECWLNVYHDGHAQEVHHHANAVISGIYYVKAPPGSGDLLIHSPYMDIMLEPPTLKPNGMNIKVVPVTPVEGKMILFRSFVKHSVKPTKEGAERISIAFNMIM